MGAGKDKRSGDIKVVLDLDPETQTIAPPKNPVMPIDLSVTRV
jgi:hypothetical protein